METPGRGLIQMFSFCSKKSRHFQTRILRDNPVLLAFRALVQTSSTSGPQAPVRAPANRGEFCLAGVPVDNGDKPATADCCGIPPLAQAMMSGVI